MNPSSRTYAKSSATRFRTARLTGILVAVGMLLVGCVAALRCQHSAVSRDQPRASHSSPVVPPGFINFVLPAKSGRCELRGGTSIGGWTSTSGDIRATAMIQISRATLDALFSRLVAGDALNLPPLPIPVESPSIMNVIVPVTSFKGGNPGMDRDMQAALKARLHPDIMYVLTSLQAIRQSSPAHGRQKRLEVHVLGQLTVAGVRRTTLTSATIYRDARGHIIVHAEQKMLMSDFGVKPPFGLFGLIHAYNPMSVIFDLDFVPDGAGKSEGQM